LRVSMISSRRLRQRALFERRHERHGPKVDFLSHTGL
jgi:hypothetical protein